MIRFLTILFCLSFSSFLSGSVAFADDDEMDARAGSFERGLPRELSLSQQSISHGSYAVLFDFGTGTFPLIGELIDCTDQPTLFVLRSSGTFDYFAGVCDDLGDRPCNSRLIYIGEACEGVTDGEQVYRIRSDYDRTPIRICYDEYGTGQCTEYEEVASGYSIGQNQGLIVDGFIQAPARRVGVRSILESKPFWIDGRRVRIPRTGAQVQVLFDMPEPVPDGCDAFLNPCGFASSAFAIGHRQRD